MSEKDYDALLNMFANGDIKSKHDALRGLIALRKHNQAAKDTRFQSGVEYIVMVGSDSTAENSDRLIAVSILSRISFSIISLRAKYNEYLSLALKAELPDLHILEDADDKAYIGKACSIVCPDWIDKYASKVVVFEETNEQARTAFLIALFKSLKSLEKVLIQLEPELSNFNPTTEEPGNTIVKRLRRLLSAIRYSISQTSPDPGEEPGKMLYDLLRQSFSNIPDPTDKKAISEVTEEIAGIIHEIIRLKFSSATQPSTYKGLIVIKKYFPAYSWENFTKKSKMMKFVVNDILEAILLLARQDIPDPSLVNYLNLTIGNSGTAKEKLKELSEKSGLSPRIKNWLVNGVFEVPISLVKTIGESEKQSENLILSDLLIDAYRYRNSEQAGRKTILSEIDILNPGLSEETKRLLNYGLSLCDTIESLSKRRGLRLRGKIGSEVEYSPVDHELISPGVNIRKVRIVRPTVDQVGQDGVSFVIRKGLVEPIQ